MRKKHYIILPAVLLILASCAGTESSPPPAGASPSETSAPVTSASMPEQRKETEVSSSADTSVSSSSGQETENDLLPVPLFEAPSYDRNAFYTTPYGDFRVISSVWENNAHMLSHPDTVSRELATVYISENEEDAEKVWDELCVLADDITADCSSQYDSAVAIAEYCSRNIYYDMKGSEENGGLSIVSCETVLRKKAGTCIGYANLMSALCAAKGILCLTLVGGSSAEGWKRSQLEEAPVNHSWNAFYADGKWYMSDPTWASPNYFYENGEYFTDEQYPAEMDFYLAFPFGEMCTEHRADRCEWSYAEWGR